MVDKIVQYLPQAETTLDLSDKSFIDPEIARKWAEMVRKFGRYRTYRFETWRADSLHEGLKKDMAMVVDAVEKERGIDWNVEVHATIEGALNLRDLLAGNAIRMASGAVLCDDFETADRIEKQNLQEQAYLSYRLAERMTEAALRYDQLTEVAAA